MVYKKKGAAGLMLGALGVVFGDIGTNPLYALHVVFGSAGRHVAISQLTVHGIISLIVWSVTIVVSIKYIGFAMRASNQGEGGIMALVSLLKSGSLSGRRKWFYIALGIVGVSLFYGDCAITPAISVLSAVEGLKVVDPGLRPLVLPITFTVLAMLFWVQHYGTAFIGRLFGPVMAVWFVVIGAGGAWRAWQHPHIFEALSPGAAVSFFVHEPLVAFLAMGAVVLAITGAEALYADMGHFGRSPIARSWFFIVFPALTLCYLGQGALLLAHPESVANPFILLFPQNVRFAVVVLATLATLIASQSVISGAFSLTRQAIQLGFLPRMVVRYTSAREFGQIYLPFVNAVLFVVVSILVFVFGSSVKLAGAYGVAVSGALAIDTILLAVVMRSRWHTAIYKIVFALGIFSSVDLVFVTSNLSKVAHGGWVPLALAAIILVLIGSWQKGDRIVRQERHKLESPLQEFVDDIRRQKPPLNRVPGQAVYIGHHSDHVPLALRATIDDLHELSTNVVLVTVSITNEAHVPEHERAVVDNLRYKDDGISHVTLSYGFHDSPNVPRALENLRRVDPELDRSLQDSSYFVSLTKVVRTKRRNMAGWQKAIYSLMARNALSMSDYYKLPVEHTVEMRSLIKL